MAHRRMLGRRGAAGPCDYVPGLYTESEVDDLINIDGYIPVATAEEFDSIRTGSIETMGGCTKWAGSYTTGYDKKYIQIAKILNETITTVGNGIDTNLTGIYDGNNLEIEGCTVVADVGDTPYSGLFNAINAVVQNVRSISNMFLQIRDIPVSAVVGQATDTDIINCEAVNCYIECTNTRGLVGSIVGRVLGTSVMEISGCFADGCTIDAGAGTTTTTVYGRGGFVGNVRNENCTIQNCYAINITMTNKVGWYSGGFAGQNLGVIDNCYCDTVQTSKSGSLSAVITGGFCGENRGNIIRCTASGSMDLNGQSNGGFIGANYGEVDQCFTDVVQVNGNNFYGGFVSQTFTGSVITNCYAMTDCAGVDRVGGFVARINDGTINNSYCVGTVSGSTFVGGFAGQLVSGSVSNSYWDTDIGPATSAAGTGQTTSALQTPTSNTGIYSTWDAAIWDFGTSTDYPTLINTP